MTIRVLLAEDHMITRQGLRALLEKAPDMEVVGEASNGRKAVSLAEKLRPDVVIMDVSMPDLNGIMATKKLVGDDPNIKIIALSMHSDCMFVTEMFKSGASGYLLKDCAFEELDRAIRHVVADKKYLSPSISGVVLEDYLQRVADDKTSGLEPLTEREREVLQLMAEGKSTKEIALKLHISIKTAETHRRQIMHKLNLFSVAELTKFAIRKGLTSLE